MWQLRHFSSKSFEMRCAKDSPPSRALPEPSLWYLVLSLQQIKKWIQSYFKRKHYLTESSDFCANVDAAKLSFIITSGILTIFKQVIAKCAADSLFFRRAFGAAAFKLIFLEQSALPLLFTHDIIAKVRHCKLLPCRDILAGHPMHVVIEWCAHDNISITAMIEQWAQCKNRSCSNDLLVCEDGRHSKSIAWLTRWIHLNREAYWEDCVCHWIQIKHSNESREYLCGEPYTNTY